MLHTLLDKSCCIKGKAVTFQCFRKDWWIHYSADTSFFLFSANCLGNYYYM